MCCSGRALQPGRRRCPDKCIFFWQLEKSHRIYHSGFMVQSTEGTSPMMETVSICARGGIPHSGLVSQIQGRSACHPSHLHSSCSPIQPGYASTNMAGQAARPTGRRGHANVPMAPQHLGGGSGGRGRAGALWFVLM